MRAKKFCGLTLKTYVIIKNKKKEREKIVRVVDRIRDNIHCVETTWTARRNSTNIAPLAAHQLHKLENGN